MGPERPKAPAIVGELSSLAFMRPFVLASSLCDRAGVRSPDFASSLVVTQKTKSRVTKQAHSRIVGNSSAPDEVRVMANSAD